MTAPWADAEARRQVESLERTWQAAQRTESAHYRALQQARDELEAHEAELRREWLRSARTQTIRVRGYGCRTWDIVHVIVDDQGDGIRHTGERYAICSGRVGDVALWVRVGVSGPAPIEVVRRILQGSTIEVQR